ncbi:nuclear transport factor 2 family protein [Mycoplana ramosa]|uniref:Nuclear transport factor 2 family protein n=1 Tax=Mycoplana ramosa TaxID=40837 RepID=A0ABW3Z1H6_MYCRA
MMDRSELDRTVRAFYRARNDHDLDAVMSLVDPDASFRIAGNLRLGPLTHVVEGASEIRARFADLIANWDLSDMEIDSMHVDGDTAVVHRTGPVRFIPQDTFYDTEMIDKLTFRDGRLIEFTEFVDTLLAAEIIGFVKPTGIWTGTPGVPKAAEDVDRPSA